MTWGIRRARLLRIGGMKETTVLVSGASGLIGSALTTHLGGAGAEVRRLVRRAPTAEGEYRWDPYDAYIDDIALKGVDAVIHLSGAGIGDQRWTDERKRILYDSRITSTKVLAEHLARLEEPPSVLISQSAIGIYGDRGDEVLTETSELGPDEDFLARLVKDWEAAAAPARQAGIRVLHPRTGLVLAPQADLIQRLLPFFKAGVGGPLGRGKHWWSWVALQDVVGAISHLIASDLSGPVNVVAPNPVRQKAFAKALGDTLGRPSLLPVPKPALSVVMGSEAAESIGFASTRVLPARLQEAGFDFHHQDLDRALADILG